MKTVAIVGVLDKKGSTNISQAKAFARFGYNVVPINYRSIIAEHGTQFFENLVIDVVTKYQPSLILFSKTNGINPELVKECGKHTKTFYWFMDSIKVAESLPEVLEQAKNAHFSSCTGGGVADWFVENGVGKCYHILDGLDPDIFKPVEAVKEYEADISFIGSRTPERDVMREALLGTGVNVKFYGNGYDKEVIDEDFAKVCASSKMMLSLNVFNHIPRYFSNRLLRYLGCGSCVVHFDTTDTVGEFFEPNKEILLFNSPDGLKNMVDLMVNFSPEALGPIAVRGREKALSSYTWYHTINKILRVAGLNE